MQVKFNAHEDLPMGVIEPAAVTESASSDPIAFLREHLRARSARLEPPESGTREDFDTWRRIVQEKLREVIGWDRMLDAPLTATTTEKSVEDGIKRERYRVQTEQAIGRRFSSTFLRGQDPIRSRFACTAIV